MLATGDRIFIYLTDAHLKSPFCMYELHAIWQQAQKNGDQFMQKVRLLRADDAKIIARHQRSYERADMVFDPMHFLQLLEQKVGALDQAAQLQGWNLPDEFATLHCLLEVRMGKAGKREYVQVLRLLETFEMEHVHGAISRHSISVRLAMTRSNICCCAGSNGDRHGWIWSFIRFAKGVGGDHEGSQLLRSSVW